MREIKECTAEVFSRSEKRIKERKRKRNRFLALCIPLCLILTVLSVTILRAMLSANDKNMSADMNMNVASSVDGSNEPFVQVEIESIGNSEQSAVLKDDANEVAQIYHIMQSAFLNADESSDEVKNYSQFNDQMTEEKYEYSKSKTAAEPFCYRIIFTSENSTKAVYSFWGDKLINESTKQEVRLSAEQQSEILNALGLETTWEEESK